MRVELHQSGGFAGLIRKGSIDSSELAGGDERKLEQVVARLRRSKRSERSPAVRDGLLYRIVVQDEGAEFEFEFDDASMTPALAKVISLFQPRMRPSPP